MKAVLKTLLKYYLKLITKLTLFIHRPVVIAVSGSTNKNFFKNEIKNRLQRMGFTVRANPKNFNTEIGMPLAILDLSSGYNEYKKWIPVILSAPLRIFRRDFPKFLVLCFGTSNKGDMKYLLSIVKPDISIVTDITQRYREGFSDMNRLVEEYSRFYKKTRRNGFVVLNSDNYRVKDIAKENEKNIIYFGFGDNANIRIINVNKTTKGQTVKIKYREKLTEYKINKFGKHHAYALAVGVCVEDLVSSSKVFK